MKHPVRTLFKLVIALVAVLALLVITIVVTVNLTPRPMAWLTNKMFAKDPNVMPVVPDFYGELSAKVNAAKDIEYPSQFKMNRLDVFSPKDTSQKTPTILWIHGGGWAGGDKADIAHWATLMAGKGYTIVSINYELAPAIHYPAPLIQAAEAFTYIKQNADKYPTVDTARMIIGGDSAGAQVASQFATIQTNPELAKAMQMDAVIPAADIKGVLLYCGPYLLNEAAIEQGSWIGGFFSWQMGWSYFGKRDWYKHPEAAHATPSNNVTAEFPSTFITDGNTGSFEPHGRDLEAKIKAKGVYVESLYFPVENGKIGHEYQFDFSTKESIECFNRTLAFLDRLLP